MIDLFTFGSGFLTATLCLAPFLVRKDGRFLKKRSDFYALNDLRYALSGRRFEEVRAILTTQSDKLTDDVIVEAQNILDDHDQVVKQVNVAIANDDHQTVRNVLATNVSHFSIAEKWAIEEWLRTNVNQAKINDVVNHAMKVMKNG